MVNVASPAVIHTLTNSGKHSKRRKTVPSQGATEDIKEKVTRKEEAENNASKTQNPGNYMAASSASRGHCLFSVVATGGLLVSQRMTSYLCTLEKDPPWLSTKPLYKLRLILFYMCKCFVCMYACAPHLCSAQAGPKRMLAPLKGS